MHLLISEDKITSALSSEGPNLQSKFQQSKSPGSGYLFSLFKYFLTSRLAASISLAGLILG